jgi:membrane peptidoglycan carboxypeptidase
LRDSTQQRQEVYTWLFKTRDKAAQYTRIQIMMENEAFQEVHRMWKRLGYPFDSLVPSYATAIGSSADRPAALAELVGILVNKGIYAPAIRIEKMHFAAGTPYETVIKPAGKGSEQVMKPEVAEAASRELLGVVERGTATRISKVFTRPDGTSFDVGGKTGTGDNRFDVYNAAGDLVRSTAINRTATFVFFIGERFFGTLTAYVPGQQAADYSFTSSLPVQVLKTLAPKLMPLINGIEPDAESARVAPPARGTAASDG